MCVRWKRSVRCCLAQARGSRVLPEFCESTCSPWRGSPRESSATYWTGSERGNRREYERRAARVRCTNRLTVITTNSRSPLGSTPEMMWRPSFSFSEEGVINNSVRTCTGRPGLRFKHNSRCVVRMSSRDFSRRGVTAMASRRLPRRFGALASTAVLNSTLSCGRSNDVLDHKQKIVSSS